MPRETIASLKSALQSERGSKEHLQVLLDQLYKIVFKKERTTLTPSYSDAVNEVYKLQGKIDSLEATLSGYRGTIDTRLEEKEIMIKRLMLLLRCHFNDPTLKLENLTSMDIFDITKDRDQRGRNPLL